VSRSCGSDAQRARDRASARVYKNVLAASQEPVEGQIFLYLRPFAITGKLGIGDGKVLDAADGTAIREEHDAQTQQWRRTEMPMFSFGVGVGDLSPFEQGRSYLAALDAGLFPSLRRLAEAVGVSHTWVRKSMLVAQLPDSVVQAFRSPLEIQPKHAEEIAAELERDRAGVMRRAEKLRLGDRQLSARAIPPHAVHEGEHLHGGLQRFEDSGRPV